jgi:hypothetical protein
MANQIFNITAIDHLKWEFVADGADSNNVVLRFIDSNGRLLPEALNITGFKISEWHFQERIYDRSDEVRVLDQNLDGAQLEFGRFVVQFVRHGKVVGQHIADSVTVRRTG